MRKIENHCVECTSLGLHCIGDYCEKRNVEVTYCDSCEWREADYRIADKEYCQECAEIALIEFFKELSLYEKANLLNITMEAIK